LNWMKSFSGQKVIIETDAESVANALEKKIYPHTNWGNVSRNIARDLDRYPFVSVKWVNRKGNQVAHNLARLAISEPNRVWHNNFPNCILSHILSDMEGVNSNL
jgi:ribonuclease HI